jgi:hypothetical protein
MNVDDCEFKGFEDDSSNLENVQDYVEIFDASQTDRSRTNKRTIQIVPEDKEEEKEEEKNKKLKMANEKSNDVIDKLEVSSINSPTLTKLQKITRSQSRNDPLTPKITTQGNSKNPSVSFKDNWIRNTSHTVFFIEKQKSDHNPSQNQSQKRIHPMELAKILNILKIKNYKELTFAGQGRFKITFDREKDAEPLINSKILINEYKYQIYVPNMFKQTIGVIHDVPPTLSDEEIAENIFSNKKITKIERICKMKDNKLIPTYSVKIYVEGSVLPDNVKIYGIATKVDYYIFPVKMCYKCLRYGHRKSACKSATTRCICCGQSHDGNECFSPARCFHCGNAHNSFDRNCSERLRQNKIQFAMATEKLTFIEASTKFPRDKISVQPRLQSIKEFPLLPTQPIDNTLTYSQQLSSDALNNNQLLHLHRLKLKNLLKKLKMK